MSTLLQWVKSLFQERSYGQELEAYIIAHNPSTPGDVEHYERQFDLERRNSGTFSPGYNWGRGL